MGRVTEFSVWSHLSLQSISEKLSDRPSSLALKWLICSVKCFHSYRQAQATVLEALPLLNKHNISTKRPDDYFAEMAKSDQHMQKVT